ncbi:hypothetical protein Leryth_022267 [Lithospermum erythrorhizon]|nr:hypothetical protein Leryth_022267 [Lithospermum erythrorhizon]
MEMSMEKPHVAFLSSPGMGHITPLFELAKRLVLHHGFQVSFLVITTEASAAQTEFFVSSTNDFPPDLHIINIPPVDMSPILTPDMFVLTTLCVIVQESLKPLKNIILELPNRPKALVIDIFCTQAIDVCRDLDIGVYSFFTASTLLLAFSLYLPTLDREMEGEYVDLPEPIQVPGCSPIRTQDLLDMVKNRKIDEYYWYFLHVSKLCSVSGIFANTWDDFEPKSLKALRENEFYRSIQTPPVYPIGPLIKQEEVVTKQDAQILAWLDDQPLNSVLFIAFGSGGTVTSEQLIELAYGIEMSKQKFIWVVRKPSDASASASFFSSGSEENDPSIYLPKGFFERTQKQGILVSSWAAQVAILGHKSTGAFLSHCGWNSSLESMVHGLPMIAWPLYAEQRQNATMLAEEFGLALKPEVVNGKNVIGRKEIENVIRLIIESDEGVKLREMARAMMESSKKALSDGGSSFTALNTMVNMWKTH